LQLIGSPDHHLPKILASNAHNRAVLVDVPFDF
jgi:hypothetical protein